METLLRITALSVLSAALGLLLKKDVPALQLGLTVGVMAALGLAALETAGEVRGLLALFTEKTGIDEGYLTLTMKCVALAVIVRLGGDLCRDAGQSALASLIELTGTLSAAVLALPLLRALVETVWSVL